MNRLLTITIVLMSALLFVACSPEPRGPAGPASGPGGSPVPTLPSAFEVMLTHIPDIAASRESLTMSDIAKMREALEIEAPEETASADEIFEYKVALWKGTRATLGDRPIDQDSWLSGITQPDPDYANASRYSLGFGPREVDQVALFGERDRNDSEVVLGAFSPTITSERLSSCDDCQLYETISHSGHDIYVWSDNYEQNLRMRLAKPTFDQFGRGGRVFVQDGMATRTLSNEHMEQIIDASFDNIPSLGDDPGYVLAAKMLAKYDVVKARFLAVSITVEFSIQQLEEAWQNGLRKLATTEELEQQFERAHKLLPYDVAAVGIAFSTSEGALANTYVVLIHSSEKDAIQNAERLEKRITEDPYLLVYNLPTGRDPADDTTITWAEYFNDYEVSTDGKAVILRVTAEQSGRNLSRALLWLQDEPFLIHNLLITE